ncbi:hypothetical protein OG373_36885 [Streptomyces avidinii]|uniref:hypothetical protein n=1 Tax=Streptomyces avidinii TaxID=1895 RepID=UPI0038683E88|nr:hypothetical protein OG373_36885 [Streptomyces avidinii]
MKLLGGDWHAESGYWGGVCETDPDFQAPEPMGFLCGLAGSMQVWRTPASDRWIALAIGQADPL